MQGIFYIDDIPLTDVGLYAVGIGNSNNTIHLMGGQSVTEAEVINKEISSFIRARKNNTSFTLYLAVRDENGCFVNGEIDAETRHVIGKYLARGVQVELKFRFGKYQSGEEVWRCIKAIPTGGIDFIEFGEMRGYFQVQFSAAPYWTTPMVPYEFNLSGTNNEFSITNQRNIQNSHGNYDVFPRIEIKDIAIPTNLAAIDRNLIIRNMTTEKEIVFKSLEGNIEIDFTLDVIQMHHGIVHSEKNENYIFNNWNKQKFYLTEGENIINVNYPCTIAIHLQVPIF